MTPEEYAQAICDAHWQTEGDRLDDWTGTIEALVRAAQAEARAQAIEESAVVCDGLAERHDEFAVWGSDATEQALWNAGEWIRALHKAQP